VTRDRPVRATRHPRLLLAALSSLSAWGAYWIAWITFGFLIPELYGVAVNAKWTLSDNVWAFERLDIGHPFDFATWTPVHYACAIVVWLLFGWLSFHLPFGLAR
jgi:hypothetical protein